MGIQRPDGTYRPRPCVVCGAPGVYGTSHCRAHRNEYQRVWATVYRAAHPYQPRPKQDRRLKHTPPIRHLDGFYSTAEIAAARRCSRQNVDQTGERQQWRAMRVCGHKFYLEEDVRSWIALDPL